MTSGRNSLSSSTLRSIAVAWEIRSWDPRIPAAIRGSQLRISQATAIERNVELLNEFRPDVISSFGSYIEELFLHLHRERPPFHCPRVVNFSSCLLYTSPSPR